MKEGGGETAGRKEGKVIKGWKEGGGEKVGRKERRRERKGRTEGQKKWKKR